MRSIRRLALSSSTSVRALMEPNEFGYRTMWLKEPILMPVNQLRLAMADNPRRQGSSGRVPSPGLTGVEGS
jgi:hypothetical protein